MTAASPPLVNFGWRAPDFRLADTKGKIWTLGTLRGSKGLLVMFICNHCPYVLAVIDKLVSEGRQLRDLGFGVAAICSNDAAATRTTATRRWAPSPASTHLPFPYLHDVNQTAARAYGAACTPDFFGFNAELKLQYRGRLDDSGPRPAPRRPPRALTRRCGRSPTPARGRASRCRRSAARSSGRPRDRFGRGAGGRWRGSSSTSTARWSIPTRRSRPPATRSSPSSAARRSGRRPPPASSATASRALVERPAQPHRRHPRRRPGPRTSPASAPSTPPTRSPALPSTPACRGAGRARRRRPRPRRLHPEAERAGAAPARRPRPDAADHRLHRRRQPRRAEARPADAAPRRRPAAAGPGVIVGDSETDAATAAPPACPSCCTPRATVSPRPAARRTPAPSPTSPSCPGWSPASSRRHDRRPLPPAAAERRPAPARARCRLAGGPLWFAEVAEHRRGAPPRRLPAAALPPEAARPPRRAPRAPVCGLALDRPRMMAVLNVTPDSFSDGGRHLALRRRARPRPRAGRPRAPTSSTSAASSTRPGAEPGAARGGGRPRRPGDRRPARRGLRAADLDRHPQRRGRPRRLRRRRRPLQRRLGAHPRPREPRRSPPPPAARSA